MIKCAPLIFLVFLIGCMTGNYKGWNDQLSNATLENKLNDAFPLGTPREHVAAELDLHGVHQQQDWEHDYYGDLASQVPPNRTPGDYLGKNTLAARLPIAWWVPEVGWNSPPKHIVVFTFDDDERLELIEVFNVRADRNDDEPEIRKVEA